MAADSGRNEKRFVDMFPDLMENIQLKLLDYAKVLKQGAAGSTLAQSGVTPKKVKLEILTEDGYPLVPRLIDKGDLKKDDLEDLLRRYLNAHYSRFEISVADR
jgi:hypothetical protein